MIEQIGKLIAEKGICIDWTPKVLYVRIPDNRVSILHKNVTLKLKDFNNREEMLIEAFKRLELI